MATSPYCWHALQGHAAAPASRLVGPYAVEGLDQQPRRGEASNCCCGALRGPQTAGTDIAVEDPLPERAPRSRLDTRLDALLQARLRVAEQTQVPALQTAQHRNHRPEEKSQWWAASEAKTHDTRSPHRYLHPVLHHDTSNANVQASPFRFRNFFSSPPFYLFPSTPAEYLSIRRFWC